VVGAPSVLSPALARLTEVTESGSAEKRRFFQKVSVSGLPGIASIIWEPKMSGAVVYFAADRTVSRKAKHRKRS
jgi:hypothetical protein